MLVSDVRSSFFVLRSYDDEYDWYQASKSLVSPVAKKSIWSKGDSDEVGDQLAPVVGT